MQGQGAPPRAILRLCGASLEGGVKEGQAQASFDFRQSVP